MRVASSVGGAGSSGTLGYSSLVVCTATLIASVDELGAVSGVFLCSFSFDVLFDVSGCAGGLFICVSSDCVVLGHGFVADIAGPIPAAALVSKLVDADLFRPDVAVSVTPDFSAALFAGESSLVSCM